MNCLQNNKGKKMSKYLRNSALIAAAALIGVTGCSTKDTIVSENDKIVKLQEEINAKNEQISQLEAKNSKAMNSINAMSLEAKDKNAVSNSLVPPNAKPGECYAKVLVPEKYETKKIKKMVKEARTNIKIIPATYKTVNQTVTVREASTKLIPVSATYKTVTEKILVKPATTKLIPVPATYKMETETIMVEPEKTKLVTVPAKYKTVSEKILVKPAYTTWKKGRGEIEKVNNATGDILCLVEVPAEYRVVTSKVIDTPASTREVKTPAVYKTVKRKVVDKPASTREVVIPAVYKTVTKQVINTPATTREVVIPGVSKKVPTRVMVTPAKEVANEIPAVYTMVPTKVKVADSYLRWQSILCETNTTADVIAKLQRTLNNKGYKAGAVDGVYGAQTKAAVKAYQRKNKMNEGALTLKTLQSLGVM